MKKIIIGNLQVSGVAFQPWLGYALSTLFVLPESVLIASFVVWGFSAIPQLFFAFSVVRTGYKELGVSDLPSL